MRLWNREKMDFYTEQHRKRWWHYPSWNKEFSLTRKPCTSLDESGWKTWLEHWGDKRPLDCYHVSKCKKIKKSNKEQDSPEWEEGDDADSDEQLDQEDGVDLQGRRQCWLFALAPGLFFFSIFGETTAYLPDEGLPDGLVVPGKLGLHVPIAWRRDATCEECRWDECDQIQRTIIYI